MDSIKNIYCVGRNYVLHAKELKNEVPAYPMLFTKPTHALVKADGQTVIIPGDRGTVHFETELVIRIGNLYEKGMKVDELVDGMAVGLDLTLRDIQDELKKKGHPWLLAKGFKNSAILGRFVEFPGIEECKKIDFALIKNGEQAQTGNIQNMIFSLQTIIDFAAHNFGLAKGDIIFTGTPQGVGPVSEGDHLSLVLDKQILGSCTIKLS